MDVHSCTLSHGYLQHRTVRHTVLCLSVSVVNWTLKKTESDRKRERERERERERRRERRRRNLQGKMSGRKSRLHLAALSRGAVNRDGFIFFLSTAGELMNLGFRRCLLEKKALLSEGARKSPQSLGNCGNRREDPLWYTQGEEKPRPTERKRWQLRGRRDRRTETTVSLAFL